MSAVVRVNPRWSSVGVPRTVLLMAALPVTSACVRVGPPLFCSTPRFSWALVTVVAQVKDPWVTRLFVDAPFVPGPVPPPPDHQP
jgi:hypothetical protein